MATEHVHIAISDEDHEELSAEPVETVYQDTEEYSEAAQSCQELSTLASSGNGVSRIAIPREVKRKRVVSAFHDAFELIGGVPRLAHWGDQHPTDFYKLYARLLPAEAGQQADSDDTRKIIHAFPPGPLDE